MRAEPDVFGDGRPHEPDHRHLPLLVALADHGQAVDLDHAIGGVAGGFAPGDGERLRDAQARSI